MRFRLTAEMFAPERLAADSRPIQLPARPPVAIEPGRAWRQMSLAEMRAHNRMVAERTQKRQERRERRNERRREMLASGMSWPSIRHLEQSVADSLEAAS